MKTFPTLIAPACLFFFMAAGEPPASAPATKPVPESQGVTIDNVSVSIVLVRPTISTDEQPEFLMRFKNVGKEGYRNLYDVGAYWKWTIQATPTDPKVASKPRPWRLGMNATSHAPNIEHRQIKPGERTDVVVNLNDPPFTFVYTDASVTDQLVAPIRHLAPGRYKLTAQVSLTSPFGPGYFEWIGPATTQPIELTVTLAKPQAVTKEEQAAYDAAIDKVTAKLPPNGLWSNGRFPQIDLPKNASVDEVIDMAVNNSSLGSKVYHILSVKPFSRENMPGTLAGKAALVQVGKAYKVVIFFPTEQTGWWSRFYDADMALPQTVPGAKVPESKP
jgi:hypothetical protein